MDPMSIELDDRRVDAPIATAARVVDIPRERLLRWERNGMLTPSRRTPHGRTVMRGYGFDDLVLARIIRLLEDSGVPHGQVRDLLTGVRREFGPSGHLKVRWATLAGEAFVQLPDETWYGGRQPRQQVLRDTLDLEELKEDIRRRLARSPEDVGRIEQRRGVHHGRPVFAGTRVTVDTVIEYIEAGLPDERILRSFPSLQPPDIAVARKQARK